MSFSLKSIGTTLSNWANKVGQELKKTWESQPLGSTSNPRAAIYQTGNSPFKADSLEPAKPKKPSFNLGYDIKDDMAHASPAEIAAKLAEYLEINGGGRITVSVPASYTQYNAPLNELHTALRSALGRQPQQLSVIPRGGRAQLMVS